MKDFKIRKEKVVENPKQNEPTLNETVGTGSPIAQTH